MQGVTDVTIVMCNKHVDKVKNEKIKQMGMTFVLKSKSTLKVIETFLFNLYGWVLLLRC